MFDKADVASAIKDYPQEAADALLAVEALLKTPINLDGAAASAALMGRNTEDAAADELERLGLLDAFVLALKARGIPIDVISWKDTHFPARLLKAFIPRAEAFRCRIFVDEKFSGSGCIIGPSLVLTAWHVIGAPQGRKLLEVELSDKTRRRAADLPPYNSPCTDDELGGKLPNNDAAFVDKNDVAVIRLERTDGIRLGYPTLPEVCPKLSSQATILLVHYPKGVNRGLGPGKVSRIPGITARWQHDVMAGPGSSGGPCFNSELKLVGLHQGKWRPHKRLVPIDRFHATIRQAVESDIAPQCIWSLDDTPGGGLVIGRDLFFEAIAAAQGRTSRVRGVRVKRRDPTQGTGGLAFSLELLIRILARSPAGHRHIRIGFEPPYADLLDEIRKRSIEQGLMVPAAEAGSGVRGGETTLEATVNDRARTFVTQLDAAAAQEGRLLWLLFDNPTVGLSESERLAFEAFVGAALKQPWLRLVLAGYETITTPGDEFLDGFPADTEGALGFVVEYFGLFRRRDVELLLQRACESYRLTPDAGEIAGRADQILLGLTAITGQYSTSDLKTVSDRAVSHLEYFRDKAGKQP